MLDQVEHAVARDPAEPAEERALTEPLEPPQGVMSGEERLLDDVLDLRHADAAAALRQLHADEERQAR